MSLAFDARLAYVENEILQADPVRLVQLLYRGALEAIGKARVFVREKNILDRSRQITKATDIINELTLSIDRERGGEIAANLVELYDYMQRRLQDANFRQIEEPLIELEKLLGTLLEAWEQCDPGPVAAHTPARRDAAAEAPLPIAAGYAEAEELAGASYGRRRLAHIA